MKYRDVYLMKAESVNDSQTKTIDLDITDPITALIIIYQADNGSTSNQGVHIHDDVDKIEVIDGSEVLFSLSGIQTQLLDFYGLGKMPMQILTEKGGATQYEMFIVPFGRWIGDPEYYLNPKAFVNPQLKLTHSFTISSTAGFATGTAKVTVIAKIIEEGAAGTRGLLKATEIHSWTTAASGDEPVNLPVDYPYRLLIARAFESGTALDSSITNLKLSFDTDKYVPFNVSVSDLLKLNELWFGHAILSKELKRTNDDTVYSLLAEPRDWVVHSRQDLDFATADALSAGVFTLSVTKTTTSPSIAAETADVPLGMWVKGTGLYHSVAWPFGDLNKPDDWLNPVGYKSAKLSVTQGNAGAAASIVLQQLKTY